MFRLRTRGLGSDMTALTLDMRVSQNANNMLSNIKRTSLSVVQSISQLSIEVIRKICTK